MRVNQCIAMIILFTSLTAPGCLGKDDPASAADHSGDRAEPPVPPVEIVKVGARPFTETADLPGRISAVRSARVCARVAGIVLSREFEEGSDVEKGQVLFRIDPDPFLAALAGAEAELALARAELDDAATLFERYRALVKTGVVSIQKHDSAQANVKKAQAQVKAARAKIKTARLNLAYATVRAPISGRIGRALVSEGALVGQGEATAMAEIRQLDPIYADFNQPVSDFLRLKSAVAGSGGSARAGVFLTLEEIDNTREGQLLFADARVNAGTGQVSLRAEFPNGDGLLLPGMFVRIQTPLVHHPRAVFIPQRAVLRDTEGQARVIVVNGQGHAESRAVTTGRMVGSTWQILSGLTPGERIVAMGADRVRPGAVLARNDRSGIKTAVN